jgi:hypothetical protein
MVGGSRFSCLIILPEISLARRLAERRNLTPPIDILSLVQNYASVSELEFPIDIDGICLDLKQHGKRPRIFYNKRHHEHRRRFTLAHELGHILIPWHVGSIVDDTSSHSPDLDLTYWQLEAEANRFASELLMPSHWANQIVLKANNPVEAVERIAERATVSFAAAFIKTQNLLSKGYIFARYSGGKLISSGRSPGTMTGTQGLQTDDVRKIFPHATGRWKKSTQNDDYHWWRFSDEVPLSYKTNREWRDVFSEIATDVGIPDDYLEKFKQRVSGVLSSANSATKNSRTVESLNSACLQRLYSNRSTIPFLSDFIQHPKLGEFLAARIDDFLQRSNNSS